MQTLFRIKDKKIYPSCKIYYGICTCGVDYTGETKRNTETRWSEHNNPSNKKSNPSRHLNKNIDHTFTWKILCQAPKRFNIRKNLEAIYISILKSSLNEQKDFERLILFKNGIT